jgi:hypothetical protein
VGWMKNKKDLISTKIAKMNHFFNLQASQQDASYAFVALAVIFCCFLSMLLIFVPKVS